MYISNNYVYLFGDGGLAQTLAGVFPVTGSQLQLLPGLLQLRRARGAVRGAARQRRGARTRLDGGRAQRRDGGSLPQKNKCTSDENI